MLKENISLSLATWEAEIRRIMVQGQPRQKVSKTPSQPISWAKWHMTVIPISTNRITVPGKMQNPIQKITKTKRVRAWLKWKSTHLASTRL
jgi:hypothetical protein